VYIIIRPKVILWVVHDKVLVMFQFRLIITYGISFKPRFRIWFEFRFRMSPIIIF
jgi:hypothetical protein